MRLNEIIHRSEFDPSAIYLHGGPKDLDGGRLKRYGKMGGDMGALFFVKESEDGWKYALGYAILKAGDGGVYRCRIRLSPDEVFDFSNPAHRRIAQQHLSPQEFKYWAEAARFEDGHLDWAVIDEDVLAEWGFKAALLGERPKGYSGFTNNVVSVGVFDASVVETLDFTPKQNLIAKYGRHGMVGE